MEMATSTFLKWKTPIQSKTVDFSNLFQIILVTFMKKELQKALAKKKKFPELTCRWTCRMLPPWSSPENEFRAAWGEVNTVSTKASTSFNGERTQVWQGKGFMRLGEWQQEVDLSRLKVLISRHLRHTSTDGHRLWAAEEAVGVEGNDVVGLDWLPELLDTTIHVNHRGCHRWPFGCARWSSSSSYCFAWFWGWSWGYTGTHLGFSNNSFLLVCLREG